MAMHANVEGRFRDNDELRYNLRALETYFPAHGHIYVVTDAQTPGWLRASDRLTIVDHQDLIPAQHLPTFDSGHIESYIHHIPQLSERYFYLNDDVLFGRPVDLADWFYEGGVYVAWSDEPIVSDEPLRKDGTALDNACRLSNQWFNEFAQSSSSANAAQRTLVNSYQHTFRTFAHSPRPMIKSQLHHLESIAPEMFAKVRSTVFRNWDRPTIVSDFVLRWALASGTAKLRDYAHLHLSIGDADKAALLDQLVSLNGKIDFFCINDTADDAYPHDPRLAQLRNTLQRMYPLPCSFEL